MDSAHVHRRQTLDVAEVLLVVLGDPLLQLARRFVGEREGDDVLRGYPLARLRDEDVDDALRHDSRLAGARAGNDLEVVVDRLDGASLLRGVVHRSTYHRARLNRLVIACAMQESTSVAGRQLAST